MLDPRDPAAVGAFIRACGLAVVSTVNHSRRPEAALVGVAALEDGTLIFDTRRDSRKLDNLRLAPHVALVVGWSDGVSLQIEGPAEIESGTQRDHYGRAYENQLPGSRALDDAFAVVTVRPAWVRVYDATTDPPLMDEAWWR